MQDVAAHVEGTVRGAVEAAARLRELPDSTLDEILRDAASRLVSRADVVLEANANDMAAGQRTLSGAVLDRLRLDPTRSASCARRRTRRRARSCRSQACCRS